MISLSSAEFAQCMASFKLFFQVIYLICIFAIAHTNSNQCFLLMYKFTDVLTFEVLITTAADDLQFCFISVFF